MRIIQSGNEGKLIIQWKKTQLHQKNTVTTAYAVPSPTSIQKDEKRGKLTVH